MEKLVTLHDQQAVTTSLQIAEVFNKNHRDVLKAIDDMKEGVAQNFADLFSEDFYTHPQNKQKYRMYYMNKDGFSLLAMGFTGSKALEFKLAYIESFNQMEKSLRNDQPLLPASPMEALELMFKATKETSESVKQLDDRVVDLEENVTLSPSEYSTIGHLVSKRVYQVIDERNLDYTGQQKSELFKAINGDIKKATGVRSRSNLRQKHYDVVYDLVVDWQPSKATLIMINQILED